MIVISTGCPAGIGPEVSVAAAMQLRRTPCVLVGDEQTLLSAAELVGAPRRRFVRFDGKVPAGRIAILPAGPALDAADRRPGHPSRRAGAAQLAYIEAAYELARSSRTALVTGPVSKAAIAGSRAPGAAHFSGHTEWLRDRDGAAASVMCFAAPGLVTSLVTTHLPLARVPRSLTPDNVALATVWLAKLLAGLDKKRPAIAVASLNPHAGESELFGREERRAIAPGITLARRRLRGRARIDGPIGAETAYRKAWAGEYDGVVAMYHDQATIPMKLVAFGEAVNITMGLSIVRTSVDHGTGYDIAWSGQADAAGMIHAIELGLQLSGARRR